MKRRMAPPLPAASRPSTTISNRWPDAFTDCCSFSSSICSDCLATWYGRAGAGQGRDSRPAKARCPARRARAKPPGRPSATSPASRSRPPAAAGQAAYPRPPAQTAPPAAWSARPRAHPRRGARHRRRVGPICHHNLRFSRPVRSIPEGRNRVLVGPPSMPWQRRGANPGDASRLASPGDHHDDSANQRISQPALGSEGPATAASQSCRGRQCWRGEGSALGGKDREVTEESTPENRKNSSEQPERGQQFRPAERLGRQRIDPAALGTAFPRTHHVLQLEFGDRRTSTTRARSGGGCSRSCWVLSRWSWWLLAGACCTRRGRSASPRRSSPPA